jgi:ABC-type branched-subunit amino acid transport system ATPase component
MMHADLVLRSEGIVAGYGDARILHGVSLAVRRATIVTIIGPNGSGKSTCLKTIVGLVRHLKGTTRLCDRSGGEVDITNIRPYQLCDLGVGYVPQMANVFTDMSVLENLQLGALPIARDHTLVRQRMEAVIEQFPVLRSRLSARAGTLSGGQRQMLAMARALVPEPVLLILDEPSAGIQPDLVDSIFATIREFSTAGLSVLLVEQKARQALEFSDYAYVLEMGRNRFEGPGPALAADPAVIDLYLGAGRLPDLDEADPEVLAENRE